MNCGLEFFSTEVSAAPPKVIAHVPPNELYVQNTKVQGTESELNPPLRYVPKVKRVRV
jgi:hypothetical protein